jgi:hypothetical protein
VPLDSAFVKLDRADEHFDSVRMEIEAWTENGGYAFSRTQNHDLTEHRFHVCFNRQPDLVRWGLIAGDCAHNLRSALDHVAWECASRHGEPPDGTEYPIFRDKARYLAERGAERKIAGIKDPAIRTLIEESQPWKRTSEESDRDPRGPADRNPLWILHELDRVDKHRFPVPILLARPRIENPDLAFEIGFSDAPGDNPSVVFSDQPIENCAVALTVYTAQPTVDVNPQLYRLKLGVAATVDDKTGDLILTLRELCKYTRWIVEGFRDMFA